MTELICPFCNGSVNHRYFEPDGPGDYEPQHNFICDGCEILVVLTDVSEKEAIAIYNKRPPWKKERDMLLEMTNTLDDHPEEYNGPCMCKVCCSYSN